MPDFIYVNFKYRQKKMLGFRDACLGGIIIEKSKEANTEILCSVTS